MGSYMKKSIFDEQTSKALKKWHMAVKKKQGRKSPTRRLGDASPTASVASTLHSTGPALHRFKTTGHSTRSFTYEDQEASDLETDPSTPVTNKLMITVDHDTRNELNVPSDAEEIKNDNDFSFMKPSPKEMNI